MTSDFRRIPETAALLAARSEPVPLCRVDAYMSDSDDGPVFTVNITTSQAIYDDTPRLLDAAFQTIVRAILEIKDNNEPPAPVC